MLIAMACAVQAHAAETARSVLDKAAAKLSSAGSVIADFTLSQDGACGSGNITLSGDRFAIITDAMSTWYDGRTQWTYSPRINEVNITEPTAEELRQVNPFAIINAFRNNYSYRLTESSASKNTVELTPRTPDDNITKVTVTFDAATNFPSLIKLYTHSGDMTITVNHIMEADKKPASAFTFNKNRYPGVEIIDLR